MLHWGGHAQRVFREMGWCSRESDFLRSFLFRNAPGFRRTKATIVTRPVEANLESVPGKALRLSGAFCVNEEPRKWAPVPPREKLNHGILGIHGRGKRREIYADQYG